MRGKYRWAIFYGLGIAWLAVVIAAQVSRANAGVQGGNSTPVVVGSIVGIGVSVVAFGIAFARVLGPSVRRGKRLGEQFPDAIVVTVRRDRAFLDAVARLPAAMITEENAGAFPWYFTLVATRDHLGLWIGDSPNEVLALEWDRVTSITLRTTTEVSLPFVAINFEVRPAEGGAVELPLVATSDCLAGAYTLRAKRAQILADRLNALRSAEVAT